MQKYISKFLKAIKEFNLIEEGDKVCVGVSGGKDSVFLCYILNEISKFYEKKFSVVAICLDCTNGEVNYAKLESFFKENEIEYKIVKTDIFEVVFDIRKEKNPCSLCAKMRKGQLNAEAKKLGCNKVALGHHADDFVETFFLSLFYEGRVNTFSPVSYFSRAKLTQIRPMIYVGENEVINAVKKFNLPIIKNRCKVDKHTKREFVKDEIKRLEQLVPNFKKQVFNATMEFIKGKK